MAQNLIIPETGLIRLNSYSHLEKLIDNMAIVTPVSFKKPEDANSQGSDILENQRVIGLINKVDEFWILGIAGLQSEKGNILVGDKNYKVIEEATMYPLGEPNELTSSKIFKGSEVYAVINHELAQQIKCFMYDIPK